jgi:hypothetical protein
MGKVKMRLHIIIGILFILASVYGCQRWVGIAEGRVEVRERPYPVEYSKKAREENRVLAVLEKGDKVDILSHQYGKDYLAYEVRLSDGRKGYVLHGNPMKIVER